MSTIPNGLYRHYKGGYYVVTGSAKHSETNEEMVVYHKAGGPAQVYVRPATMWTEQVLTKNTPPLESRSRFWRVSGLDLIVEEREKQIGNGYGADHDDEHVDDELVQAAEHCLDRVMKRPVRIAWPWPEIDGHGDWSTMRQLIVAGALIVAELERRMRTGESP